MKLIFRQNDPLNTLVLDDSGTPLYEIDTPFSFIGGGITTIRRINLSYGHGSGVLQDVVSQIDWSVMGNVVSLPGARGARTEVSSYLVKKGMFSHSRSFIGPDGREYKWKLDSGELFLVNSTTRSIVAQLNQKTLGLFSGKPQKMSLDVNPELVPFLETILVTFVIMEHKRRSLKRSRSSMASNNMAFNSGAVGNSATSMGMTSTGMM